MTRDADAAADPDELVQAKLPRWLVTMAKEVGAQGVPRRESVGAVVARLVRAPLKREHRKLTKKGA